MSDLEDYTYILKKMHDKLSDPDKSLVISAIEATPRTIQDKLQAGSYKTNGDDLMKRAVSEGMVRLKEPNTYVLTAKGAWVVETNFLGYSLDDLLDKIDGKKFGNYEKNKKITDKNKVILLSLISTRAFSKETVAFATLCRDDTGAEAFWTALSESADFLLKNKIISMAFAEMYNETGQKGKFGTLFGEIDRLTGTTHGIFVSGGSKYYLKVTNEDGDLDQDKICHILQMIFGEVPLSLIEPLNEFCFEVSRTCGALMSEDVDSYCSSEWDGIIKKCIETASGI